MFHLNPRFGSNIDSLNLKSTIWSCWNVEMALRLKFLHNASSNPKCTLICINIWCNFAIEPFWPPFWPFCCLALVISDFRGHFEIAQFWSLKAEIIIFYLRRGSAFQSLLLTPLVVVYHIENQIHNVWHLLPLLTLRADRGVVWGILASEIHIPNLLTNYSMKLHETMCANITPKHTCLNSLV